MGLRPTLFNSKKKKKSLPNYSWGYRVFSHDVTAAILVSQNNETAAMLVQCPKPILWEFNSFLMQTLSFVPINLHRCWSATTSRGPCVPTSSPGLLPPHPFFKGKALGTRLPVSLLVVLIMAKFEQFLKGHFENT